MRKKDPESEVERKRQSYDFSVSKFSEAKRQQGRQGTRERAKVVNLERRTEKQSARQTENDSFILTDE